MCVLMPGSTSLDLPVPADRPNDSSAACHARLSFTSVWILASTSFVLMKKGAFRQWRLRVCRIVPCHFDAELQRGAAQSGQIDSCSFGLRYQSRVLLGGNAIKHLRCGLTHGVLLGVFAGCKPRAEVSTSACSELDSVEMLSNLNVAFNAETICKGIVCGSRAKGWADQTAAGTFLLARGRLAWRVSKPAAGMASRSVLPSASFIRKSWLENGWASLITFDART